MVLKSVTPQLKRKTNVEIPRWSGTQSFVYAHNFQKYGEVTETQIFRIIFKNYCLFSVIVEEQGLNIQEGPQASKQYANINYELVFKIVSHIILISPTAD